MCAAEFEVPRSFPTEVAYELIFKLLEAANEQVAGRWRGSQLGVTSFVYEAAAAYGVSFDGDFVCHEGWGMCYRALSQRAIQAYNDIRSFPSSLHLLARKMGDWQVKLVRTQYAMNSGWIASYLRRLREKIAEDDEAHMDAPQSSSGERPLEGAKRQRSNQGAWSSFSLKAASSANSSETNTVAPSTPATFFSCIYS